MAFQLLTEFQKLFDGRMYRHRASNQGDRVALYLFEDLLAVGRSRKLVQAIQDRTLVVNIANIRKGINARRGDGTLGELIPGQEAADETNFSVSRGPIATVEVGAEVKILAKAMIKQIDRVVGDLIKQVDQFRRGAGTPICVGVVGVNSAAYCIGYEGDRAFRTNGKNHKHPIQEAAEAERRLNQLARPSFDEFLVLHYRATNDAPYPFEWADRKNTEQEYGAILARICREYDRRF